MEIILILAVAALLGLIPANIAKGKGYSFGLWWFYGWMLFIVAIIHSILLPDRNAYQTPIMQNTTTLPQQPPAQTVSAADELKKYKELMDQGVITAEEFAAKKEQLLKLL